MEKMLQWPPVRSVCHLVQQRNASVGVWGCESRPSTSVTKGSCNADPHIKLSLWRALPSAKGWTRRKSIYSVYINNNEICLSSPAVQIKVKVSL